MRSLIHKASLLFLASPLLVLGQSSQGNYSSLPLTDLSAFESSGPNWSVKGNISVHPTGLVKTNTQSGTGVLIGYPGGSITTKVKANDLRLYAEFMVSPGAEGNLVLPGGQKVLISDSHQQRFGSARTTGFIGQFPTQNASKAPGLWQTIELAYDASVAQLPTSARLNILKLNGVTVLETVYLPTTKSIDQAQPITFEVNKGTIAFRNIGYQLLVNRKPLTLNNLSYKVYADKWDSKEYSKLDHEGKTETLTQEVTNGMREFHLIYEGDVQVQERETIFLRVFIQAISSRLT